MIAAQLRRVCVRSSAFKGGGPVFRDQVSRGKKLNLNFSHLLLEENGCAGERREQIIVRLVAAGTVKLTWNLQYNGALALAPNTYVWSPKCPGGVNL